MEQKFSNMYLYKSCMLQLPQFFSVDELTQFSKLFQDLNDPLNTDIADICDEIYKLYGSDRKHLISGKYKSWDNTCLQVNTNRGQYLFTGKYKPWIPPDYRY